MREKNLEECLISLAVGSFLTVVLLAFIKDILSTGEYIAFWMGMQGVLTYATWSLITWIKRRFKYVDTGDED